MQNVRRFVTKIGDDARLELLEGVKFGANAVGRTLGPHGRNWVSGVRGGAPHITNDGVSILRELWHPDEIKMLGLRTMREAALKLNDICGDGTTSAAVLTYHILFEATKKLGYTVIDPATDTMKRGTIFGAPAAMDLKRQIDAECLEVIEKLKAMARPVASCEELVGAVRVSAEDEKLAQMIGEMQWQLGADGTIIVEDSNDPNDEMENINGIRFDNGFPTSRMINNQEKQILELSDVPVILTNTTIHAMSDFKSSVGENNAGIIDAILRNRAQNGQTRQVVIVANKFDQLAMSEIAENMKNGIMICPINAPYVNRNEIFRDMAAVLGGTFVDTEENRSLRDMTLSDVGFASKVQASRWNAIFAGLKDEKAENRIESRVQVLQKELKGEKSPFAAKMLETRISQLKGGIGLMKVGGLSEAEQQRKRDKVDDAVASARASMQEGLVPGAGLALKEIADGMPDISILKKPLQAIHARIMANAGGEFTVEDWVKDPLKVVRLVVEKAGSIAGNLVTAEGAIDHENPKTKYIEMGAQDTADGGADGVND